MPIFAVDNFIELIDDESKPFDQQNAVTLRTGRLPLGLRNKFLAMYVAIQEAQGMGLTVAQHECLCFVIRAESWRGPDFGEHPIAMATVDRMDEGNEFVIRMIAKAAELHAIADRSMDDLLSPISPKTARQTRRGKKSSGAGKTSSAATRRASANGTSTSPVQ